MLANESCARARSHSLGVSASLLYRRVLTVTLFLNFFYCDTVLANDPARAPSRILLDVHIAASLISPIKPQPSPSNEFRPRARSILDPLPNNDNSPGNGMLPTTTPWQRLRDYRAHERVRLITLWQSSSSTLSLQADKHGDPSVQWSNRKMSRDDASRGLLDRFF